MMIFQAESFGNVRIAYFGTSSEAHAIDKPVYKVQIHPPGSKFASNGLPLTRLFYRNDDGGPGFSKDSYLQFDPPADGEYIVRIRDVRGEGSPLHAYRLTIREPRPDFRLSVNPKNPNVPAGGVIPLTVTAFRMDDFDGPIDVTLEGLPAGFHATKASVGKGQVFGTVLLSADAKVTEALQFQVRGRARAGNREMSHLANPDDHMKLASTMPLPDVLMTAETSEVELEPGGTAEVTVTVSGSVITAVECQCRC